MRHWLAVRISFKFLLMRFSTVQLTVENAEVREWSRIPADDGKNHTELFLLPTVCLCRPVGPSTTPFSPFSSHPHGGATTLPLLPLPRPLRLCVKHLAVVVYLS